jgi:mediator of RNA polymerase II transcription subunit 14
MTNRSQLGYIPPETISSEKALKLLRYMNTSLSIRLNVHEKIPRPFQKWRVESGRATFIVDDEFEVDLLSFVEDSSEQWHFIDLRLLFSPAPSITVGSQFHLALKGILDHRLRENLQDGLEECYNYLHNFTLTHKINVLREQAHELVRAGWAGSLKIDSVHRGLVVQYWTDKPGKKNWLEIGINSNKPKNGKVSWRGPPISSLAVKWYRQNVEVTGVDLHVDWKKLSMEKVLKHVIARHVEHLLSTAHQALNPAITTKATYSANEPSDCRLEASLGSGDVTTLSIEPVTGNYVLQPITSQSSGAEKALNHPQQAANTGTILMQLLARSVTERIKKIAQQIGWRLMARQSLRLDVIREAVQLNVSEFALFWPRGWPSSWALAALVDASGESWWIFELGSKGSTIESTRQINREGPHGHAPPVNRSTLAATERTAVNTLAYHVTTQKLAKQGKSYGLFDKFAQSGHNSSPKGVARGFELHLKTEQLLASRQVELPWLEPMVHLVCYGLRSITRNVRYVASGTMLPDAAADIQKLMSASPQEDFTFTESGVFQLKLSTPFGGEVITELKTRLRALDRLRSFASIIQKRHMRLMSSSLQQVQFQYGFRLSATVNFEEASEISILFGNDNPHKRIKCFLTDQVNDKLPEDEELPIEGDPGLDKFCSSLLFTRSLVVALQAIETQQPGNYRNPFIHNHALGTYRITYANPLCSFDVRVHAKDDKVLWQIEDNESKPADFRPKDERSPNFKRPEALKQALQKLYREQSGRWYGVRTGIIAEVDGIGGALMKLHETVLSCYVEGGFKQESPSNPGPPPAPTGAPPTNKPNSKGPGSGPKPNGGGAAPNGKMPPAKMNSTGAKPTTGSKREIITID